MLYLPMPSEWTTKGEVSTVTRYEYFRIPILGLPSLETLTDAEVQLMDEYDAEEAKQIPGEEQ